MGERWALSTLLGAEAMRSAFGFVPSCDHCGRPAERLLWREDAAPEAVCRDHRPPRGYLLVERAPAVGSRMPILYSDVDAVEVVTRGPGRVYLETTSQGSRELTRREAVRVACALLEAAADAERRSPHA